MIVVCHFYFDIRHLLDFLFSLTLHITNDPNLKILLTSIWGYGFSCKLKPAHIKILACLIYQ